MIRIIINEMMKNFCINDCTYSMTKRMELKTLN